MFVQFLMASLKKARKSTGGESDVVAVAEV